MNRSTAELALAKLEGRSDVAQATAENVASGREPSLPLRDGFR
jgi:hypothetical protein